MSISPASRRWPFAAMACMILACAPRPEGLKSPLPSAEKARAAVVAALEGWSQGRPAGKIGTAEAPIEVVDNHRPAGRKLLRFEILGNAAREDSRLVTARVTLNDPEESTLVRYQVFGVRPLWVARQEDLDMLGHWDDSMMDEAPAPAPAPAADRGGP